MKEGIRRDEEEGRKREVDKRRIKKLKEKNLPKAIELISKMNDAEVQTFKTKLMLPAPTITEDDFD